MMKKYAVFLVVLLVMAVGFYFYKSNMPTDNNYEPASVADPLNNSTEYTHPEYGYKVDIPEGYKVEPNGDYSIQILPDVEPTGPGPANFIYISVVPANMRYAETGEVYNYNPDHYQKLIALSELGESTNFAEGDVEELSEWFKYTYVSTENIDGTGIKKFENTKPWEFPPGTTESRYIYDTGEEIYIMGYYTGGENVDEDVLINPATAHSVILSFEAN